MKKIINALRKIKTLSQKYNIKLTIFITPFNQHKMDGFEIDSYLEFLEKLATVTGFYDFSGYNAITVNDCNFYETSHYREMVGDLII